MLSTLADQVWNLLALALDYTERLEQGTLEAQQGLELPGEMLQGLIQQRHRLAVLSQLFEREHRGQQDAGPIDRWLFDRLRDLWSLHPQNSAFQALMARLFLVLNGEPIQRLRQDLQGQWLVAHVSCQPRVDRAQASVESFPADTPGLRHLIVVGDPDHQAGGFLVDYDGTCLKLSCRDDYEGHCEKCLHLYGLLAWTAAPALLYKLDDDVALSRWDDFRAHLEDLQGAGAVYAGHVVAGSPNHRKFWHGWHLQKCRDAALESMGYQAPIASAYAEGGFGYALAPAALDALAYAYFTHRAFLESFTILYEDATVGLFLELAKIPLQAVYPPQTGLMSERHQAQIQLNLGWDAFQTRQQSTLVSLQDHPLLNIISPPA